MPDFTTFFAGAPALHPNYNLIKGKAMEKILRRADWAEHLLE